MTNKIARIGLLTGLMLGGVIVAGPVFAADHGHDRGRNEHRQRDEYRGRDVYEGAPPVVVAPEGYYTQPGATLSFNLPFFR